MKTIFKILLASVFFISCGDADTAIYDGSNSQTFISFSAAVYSLPIEIDATGTLDVLVNSSTISGVDRTFNISVVADESNADPLTYNLPTSVTIPAGSNQGVLTITGQDNNLEETKQLVITLDITPGDDIAFDSNKAIINVSQICPIEPGKFTGNYKLEQVSEPNDFGDLAFNTQIVNIQTDGTNSVARKFSAVYLESEDIEQPASIVPFQLLCGNVIVAANIDTYIVCDSNAPTSITLGPATVPATYDADDDSVFYLTFTEFVTDGSCGIAPLQTTLKFTKQ